MEARRRPLASIRSPVTRWLLALVVALAPAIGEAQSRALHVCADPNNLPFSHRDGTGLENRIAELFGAELGLPVEYTWYPQRIGFIRDTLHAWIPDERRYRCSLVMSLPSGFELAATTRPYYWSTYALVYVRGRGLDSVHTAEDLLALPDAQRRALRIGIFDHSPATDWLLKHGLINQAVPYQRASGDPEVYPGRIIERDLVEGALDMAFIWGPVAGYFAQRITSAPLVVVALRSEPGVRFHYAIAMGVRYGEREWLAQVEQLIENNRETIRSLLGEYGIPLVDENGDVLSLVGD
jgi:mxaJ protein